MSTKGPHTYTGAGTEFREFEGRITVGDYCSIGDFVLVFAGGEHHAGWVSTYPFDVKLGVGTASSYSRGDVTIGSDVWIGTGVVIPHGGITIGHGAIIGAKSVVTRDIPPYAIAVGNPARVIRHRFDPRTVKRLLAVAWWEWPEPKVKDGVPLMVDVEAFLEWAEGCAA